VEDGSGGIGRAVDHRHVAAKSFRDVDVFVTGLMAKPAGASRCVVCVVAAPSIHVTLWYEIVTGKILLWTGLTAAGIRVCPCANCGGGIGHDVDHLMLL